MCGFDFWGNRSCSGTKWSAFLAASPNEVGDTLAGFAGALAFVWLIATVVLQGQELREQRLEFEKMADAQAEQVKVLEKQREIFEDEQKQRNELAAKEELDELIKLIGKTIRRYTDASPVFRSQYLYSFWLWMGNSDEEDVYKVPEGYLDERYRDITSLDDEGVIKEFASRLELFVDEDINLQFPKQPTGLNIDRAYHGFYYLEEDLQELEKLKERLSRAECHRLRRIGASHLRDKLVAFRKVSQ